MLRIVVAVALGFHLSCARRFQNTGVDVRSIACPVLAAIIKRNFVKEDEYGRVSQNDTLKGLMMTGNTDKMAYFQAGGIAAYVDRDLHQNNRTKFADLAGLKDARFLNYRSMNRRDKCRPGGRALTHKGINCNANVEFQQHGFSTTLRDPEGGGASNSRFNHWFVRKSGVLTRCNKCGGRVMKLAGMAKLLEYTRGSDGDQSSEFSLNGGRMQKFHPSVKNQQKKAAASQWQHMLAWSGFWAAFAHEKNGESFMLESDLRSFFVDGAFPSGWKMKPWGFRETFETIVAMSGMGAGDEFANLIHGLLLKVGNNADEATLMRGFMGAVIGLGINDDNVQQTFH